MAESVGPEADEFLERVRNASAGPPWFGRSDSVSLRLPTCDSDSVYTVMWGWLGSRVVSVLDTGAEGPGFKSQPRRCRATVLGKLFTPIVPLFTKQRNW